MNRLSGCPPRNRGKICAGNQTDCNLTDEGYAWDGAGNLTARQQDGNMEAYLYDSLNRLNRATLTMQGGITANTITQRFEYDALGNLCYRYSIGYTTRAYAYTGRSGCGLGGAMNSAMGSGGAGALGPHQVSDLVNGTDHLFHYYDARGNQTQRDAAAAANDRTVKYSADNKLVEATPGGGTGTRFWYGSDGQRYKRDDGGKKTLYIGNVEIVVLGASVTTKRVVAGVVLQTLVGSAATSYYLFHDQLGSLVRIAEASSIHESLHAEHQPTGAEILPATGGFLYSLVRRRTLKGRGLGMFIGGRDGQLSAAKSGLWIWRQHLSRI